MIDQTSNTPFRYVFFWSVNDNFPWVENQVEPVYVKDEPFTKSNGTVMSRIYERLTKASRRAVKEYDNPATRQIKFEMSASAVIRNEEESYRRGVYDTLKALQDDLSG